MRERNEDLELLGAIEALIVLGAVLEADYGRCDESRVNPTTGDEVDQLGSDTVGLYYTGLILERFDPERTDGEIHVRADIGMFLEDGGARNIVIYADLADAALEAGHVDHLLGDDRRLELQLSVKCLHANAIDGSVDTHGFICENLGHRVRFGKVDGDGTDGAGDLEAVVDVVDGVNAGGATQNGAIGSHQANRTGPEDGDAVSRLETRPGECRPAGGQNITHGDKALLQGWVGLVQRNGQGNQVGVRGRDTGVLGC